MPLGLLQMYPEYHGEKLRKSVSIWQSYQQKCNDTFSTHCVSAVPRCLSHPHVTISSREYSAAVHERGRGRIAFFTCSSEAYTVA